MGEVMVVIYNSLAQSYKDTVAELEESDRVSHLGVVFRIEQITVVI